MRRVCVAMAAAALTFACAYAASAGALIGEAKATEAALAKAGMTASEVTVQPLTIENVGGVAAYIVTFSSKSITYRAAVNGETAEVIDLATVAARQDDRAGAAISHERALEISMGHAGVNRADSYEIKVELDYEHGRRVWEVEFKSRGMEYDYEIDAADGTILKAKKERD